MFLFQVFVNSAMTMGAAPITGIPLPFVSVGGSSMITNFLAIGDPAGDPRPAAGGGGADEGKGKLGPLAVLGVVRELRRGGGDPRPLVVAGARELVPLLARELRAGGDAVGGRRGRARERRGARLGRRAGRGAAARGADRAGVPIVAVTDDETPCRTCSRPTSSACRPGQGFPVDEIARAVARQARRGRHGARRAPARAARAPCATS